MSDKAKKTQVILKRQVVTKAVVTEKFKQFLGHELKQNVEFYKNRIAQIDLELANIGLEDPSAANLQLERREAEQYIQSETDQEKFITDLEINSHYSQGPVEGFVTVNVGDNLYEKLGGIEILVEDGIVKKIATTKSQYQAVVD